MWNHTSRHAWKMCYFNLKTRRQFFMASMEPCMVRRMVANFGQPVKPSTGVVENFDSGHPVASEQSLEPNSAITENMAPDNSSSPGENLDSNSVGKSYPTRDRKRIRKEFLFDYLDLLFPSVFCSTSNDLRRMPLLTDGSMKESYYLVGT